MASCHQMSINEHLPRKPHCPVDRATTFYRCQIQNLA